MFYQRSSHVRVWRQGNMDFIKLNEFLRKKLKMNGVKTPQNVKFCFKIEKKNLKALYLW